jgi:large subunit ribosomal protein L22
MEAKAVAKYKRISPSKVRLIANEIKGYDFPDAVDTLKAIPRKGSGILLKVILSAAANAKVKNPDLREDSLFLKKLVVDSAPMFKRFQPRARGRASRIRKRNCHITVVLATE